MERDPEAENYVEKEKNRRERNFTKELGKEILKNPEIRDAEMQHEEDLVRIEAGVKRKHEEEEVDGGELMAGPGVQPGSASSSGVDQIMHPPPDLEGQLAAKRKAETGVEEIEMEANSERRRAEHRGAHGREPPPEPMIGAACRRYAAPGDLKAVDVSQNCGPPWVAPAERQRRLLDERSMDLRIDYDFSMASHQKRAIQEVLENEPFCLITSPERRMASVRQNMNEWKAAPGKIEEEKRRARAHLEFCAKLHKLQHDAGRYFMHEHPLGARSWQEASIVGVAQATGAQIIRMDQCRDGFTTINEGGVEIPAMKSARWVTNMAAARATMTGRYQGAYARATLPGSCGEESRTRKVKECPQGVCKAIVDAIRLQKQWDAAGLWYMGSLDGAAPDYGAAPPEENHEEELARAWDDITGIELDAGLVKAARAEEIQYYRAMGTYIKVPRAEALAAGIKPIDTRWVDTNKGDSTRVRVRSRLVAKQFNNGKGGEDLFAATPPIEALRAILSSAVSSERDKCLMSIDVSRAYMYAKAKGTTYIEIPPEDIETEEDKDKVGLLVRAMYGTRAAAQEWQDEFTQTLKEDGFIVGKSSPCLFWDDRRDIKVFVHGDDFLCSGSRKALEELRCTLGAKYKIKSEMIGEDMDLKKEMKVLNRTIKWVDNWGVTCEADARHAEIIIDQTGANDKTSLKSPWAKDDNSDFKREPGETDEQKRTDIARKKAEGKLGNKKDKRDSEVALDSTRATQYRALVARANYLAVDRVDLQFPVKELARKMSSPSETDWDRLVRLARYLRGRPRLVMGYPYQPEGDHVVAYTDSDWAGCRRTRRSTSGGCVSIGAHCLKAWSRTQAIVALSSGEAELYASVKGSAELLGIQAMLKDLGIDARADLLADASAALGIIRRMGLGKTRHVDVNWLWVQEKHKEKAIHYGKVKGEANPADLFTKGLGGDEIDKHVNALNGEFLYEFDSAALMTRDLHVIHNDLDVSRLKDELSKEYGIEGEYKAWVRTDLRANVYKGSMKGGPRWSDVQYRITADTDSQTILNVERAQDLDVEGVNRKIRGGARDLTTILLYSEKTDLRDSLIDQVSAEVPRRS